MSATVTCLGVVLDEQLRGREWSGRVDAVTVVVVTRDTELEGRWYAYSHYGEPLDRVHVSMAHTPQAAADELGRRLERGNRRLCRAAGVKAGW